MRLLSIECAFDLTTKSKSERNTIHRDSSSIAATQRIVCICLDSYSSRGISIPRWRWKSKHANQTNQSFCAMCLFWYSFHCTFMLLCVVINKNVICFFSFLFIFRFIRNKQHASHNVDAWFFLLLAHFPLYWSTLNTIVCCICNFIGYRICCGEVVRLFCYYFFSSFCGPPHFYKKNTKGIVYLNFFCVSFFFSFHLVFYEYKSMLFVIFSFLSLEKLTVRTHSEQEKKKKKSECVHHCFIVKCAKRLVSPRDKNF